MFIWGKSNWDRQLESVQAFYSNYAEKYSLLSAKLSKYAQIERVYASSLDLLKEEIERSFSEFPSYAQDIVHVRGILKLKAESALKHASELEDFIKTSMGKFLAQMQNGEQRVFGDMNRMHTELAPFKASFDSLYQALRPKPGMPLTVDVDATQKQIFSLHSTVMPKEKAVDDQIEKIKTYLTRSENNFYNHLSANVSEFFVYEFNWLRNLQYDMDNLAKSNSATKTYPNYSPTILASLPYPQEDFFKDIKQAVSEMSPSIGPKFSMGPTSAIPTIFASTMIYEEASFFSLLLDNKPIDPSLKLRTENAARSDPETGEVLLQKFESALRGRKTKALATFSNFSYLKEKVIDPSVSSARASAKYAYIARMMIAVQLISVIDMNGQQIPAKSFFRNEESLKSPEFWIEGVKLILAGSPQNQEHILLLNYCSSATYLGQIELQKLVYSTWPPSSDKHPAEIIRQVEMNRKEDQKLFFFVE